MTIYMYIDIHTCTYVYIYSYTHKCEYLYTYIQIKAHLLKSGKEEPVRLRSSLLTSKMV